MSTTFLRVTLGRCGSRGPCLCHLCQRVQHRWSHILRAQTLEEQIYWNCQVIRILFLKGLSWLQESLMKHGNTPTRHCKYSAGTCQRFSNSSKHLKNCQRLPTCLNHLKNYQKLPNSMKHSPMLVTYTDIKSELLNCPLFRTICYWPPVKECSRSSSRRSLSTTRWW